MAIVVVLCITVAILFAFRQPYLECVAITKRRSLSRTAVVTIGNGTANGYAIANGNDIANGNGSANGNGIANGNGKSGR